MSIKNSSNKDYLIHFWFTVGLLLKTLNATAEIASGIILIFLSPGKLYMLIKLIALPELREDPHDLVMNYVVNMVSGISISSLQFAVLYLLSHGITKMIVILLLWEKKLWGYPLSIVIFTLFIVYQMYHYFLGHSIFLLLLSIYDAAMIAMIYLEYKRIKAEIYA